MKEEKVEIIKRRRERDNIRDKKKMADEREERREKERTHDMENQERK